jgi:hypothetical protein
MEQALMEKGPEARDQAAAAEKAAARARGKVRWMGLAGMTPKKTQTRRSRNINR